MTDVLRTPETIAVYRTRRQELGPAISKVNLCTLPLVRQWKRWVLVENQFPYDKIASKHNLLVPVRQFVNDPEMNSEERDELTLIKEEFAETREYDAIIENIKHNRTVPGQFHLHCVKYHHVTPIQELS